MEETQRHIEEDHSRSTEGQQMAQHHQEQQTLWQGESETIYVYNYSTQHVEMLTRHFMMTAKIQLIIILPGSPYILLAIVR